MTVQLSWVDEVKRAGLSLIPAKGRVKAGARICISARQTQASSAKNPGCSSAWAPCETEYDQGVLETVSYLSKQSFV